jgi:hypothetical protein
VSTKKNEIKDALSAIDEGKRPYLKLTYISDLKEEVLKLGVSLEELKDLENIIFES